MKHALRSIALLTSMMAPVFADEGNQAIDYAGFAKLTRDVEVLRQSRRISEEKFIELSGQAEVVILDSRSKAKFDQLHVKGAIHLNFSDFTEKALRKLIPDTNTPILIYCNNNFEGAPVNFALKKGPVALNIPTFINLHAYGYENIYELKPLLDIKTTKIPFAGLSLLKCQG